MDQIFDTPERVDLDVELDEGQVDVRVDPDKVTTTGVRITGPHSERFHVYREGRTIHITPPKDPSRRLGSHHIDVALPRGGDLTISSGSAGVGVVGRVGTASIHTGSGRVRCERADLLAVSTGSGDVHAEGVRVLRAKSGSGNVTCEIVSENAAVTTGSGGIRLDHLTGSATAKSGSGGLRIGRLDGDIRFDTGSGGVTILRAVRGRIDLTGTSGKVRIAVAGATPVWTDITSVSGRVESTLPPLGEPKPGQPHVEVRVHTVSGKVRLESAGAGSPGDRPGPQDRPPGQGGPSRPGGGPRRGPVPAYPHRPTGGPDHAAAYADRPQDTTYVDLTEAPRDAAS